MNSSNSKKGGWSKSLSEKQVIANLQKQMTLTYNLYNFSKPTIAALPGAAAGAGLSMAHVILDMLMKMLLQSLVMEK